MTETLARPARAGRDAHARFLEEAERLFAESGYSGTSIRAIAQAANASLGTLHQYWRSKRALFADIFERRFGPIHAERLERLKAIEQQAAETGKPPRAEALVRALLEPLALHYAADQEEARLIRSLLGRALVDPAPEVVETMRGMATESYRLLVPLLQEALPQLEVREFYARLTCVMGVSAFINIRGERSHRLAHGAPQDADWDESIERIVHFLTAGLEASPA